MKTWTKWLLVGLISVAFGVLVLSNAALASLSMTLITGILFALVGGFQIVGGITEIGVGNKVWHVILGVMMMVLGLSFVTNPMGGTVSLALLVTSLLAAGGVVRMLLAWQMRTSSYFWAMLVSGSASILLAGLIFADFATISTALIGVILGIELIINGLGAVVLALFLRLMR